MSPRAKTSTAEHVGTSGPVDAVGTPDHLTSARTSAPRPARDGSSRPGGREPRDEAGGPVHRALAILELLGAPGRESSLGVVEIARKLGRDKSQVSRVLKLLADAGFLDREAGTLRYRIGTRLFSIGAKAVDQRMRDEADVIVAREAALLGERVEVCVRGSGSCMTISTAAPDSELRAVGWVGRTVPLSCTAAGRALLFDLDTAAVARIIVPEGLAQAGPSAPRSLDELVGRIAEDRRRGWSLARQEMDRGLLAVGAPVRDATGVVVAAISVSGPESRIDPILHDVSSAVLRAASHLSLSLGATDSHAPDRPSPTTPRTSSAPEEGAS